MAEVRIVLEAVIQTLPTEDGEARGIAVAVRPKHFWINGDPKRCPQDAISLRPQVFGGGAPHEVCRGLHTDALLRLVHALLDKVREHTDYMTQAIDLTRAQGEAGGRLRAKAPGQAFGALRDPYAPRGLPAAVEHVPSDDDAPGSVPQHSFSVMRG